MVGSRNLRDVRPQTIVSTSELVLLCTLAELHVRVDLDHLFPRDTHPPATPEPGRDPPDEPGPPTPDAGAAENRDHLEGFARSAFERDVVDLAATSVV